MSLLSRAGTAEKQSRTAESWIEEINFYETEIRSCELSLEQFIPTLQQNEKLIAAEHFQNRLIRQQEVVNDLKFKIRQYLRDLSSLDGEEVDEAYEDHFNLISEEVGVFHKLFNDMLLEFDDFMKDCDGC